MSRHQRDARRRDRVDRANRDTPFLLYFHSWATHMPYDILHAERQDWLAAKEEVISGIQADSASALEAMREAYRQAVERQSETLFASSRGARDARAPREDCRSPSSPITGSRGASASTTSRMCAASTTCTGRRSTTRSSRCRSSSPCPGGSIPQVVYSQVRAVDLAPTLLELADLPAGDIDGESLLPLAEGREEGDRAAMIAGTDMGALTKLAVRLPPWKLIVDVETGAEDAYRLDADPRELAPRVRRAARSPGCPLPGARDRRAP